jgi:hypothetical protein
VNKNLPAPGIHARDFFDYFYDVQSQQFPFDFAMTICPNLRIIQGNGQAAPDSRLAQH